MVNVISGPDPHRLLPPVLACLPAAFASTRPPLALLPLVSPVLRQRLQFLTPSFVPASDPTFETWLRLLCWDNEKAAGLKDVLANSLFEPHPSSGEIEIGEIAPVRYQRSDEETLIAQISLLDWGLAASYLWCADDEGESGWRLAELCPCDGVPEEDTSWSASIAGANEGLRGRLLLLEGSRSRTAGDQASERQEDEAYWAQYDDTPGRSPSQEASPARRGKRLVERPGSAETDYYAKYTEVQAAMDNHCLSGEDDPNPSRQSFHPTTGSNNVTWREEGAGKQSAFQLCIRQHIGTSIENLYRLAISAGMQRKAVTRLIQTELEKND